VVGACIGAKNHCLFAAFATAAAAGGLTLLGCTSARLNALQWPWTARSWERWETYVHIVLLVAQLYLAAVSGLATYHCALLWRGQVSRDRLRFRRQTQAALDDSCSPLAAMRAASCHGGFGWRSEAEARFAAVLSQRPQETGVLTPAGLSSATADHARASGEEGAPSSQATVWVAGSV